MAYGDENIADKLSFRWAIEAVISKYGRFGLSEDVMFGIIKDVLNANDSDGYEDDGQPSEMQEWQDYDRDC